MRSRTYLSALTLVVAATFVALAACGGAGPTRAAAATSDTATSPPSITASGTGRVTGVPDTLLVSLTAHSEGSSAHDTLQANSDLAQQIIDTATSAGVDHKDIQTTNVSVGPRYDGTSRPRVIGYEADESFAVKLRDLAHAGAAIDALSALGDGVQLQGVSYSIDDDTQLLAAARADAVNRAKTQAQQLAQAAGVSLGAVRSITEASAPTTTAVDQRPMAAAGDTSAAVPLAPGSDQLTLTVTVVYDIA